MKISVLLIYLCFQILLQSMAVAATPGVAMKRSVKLLINTDDAINLEVNRCLKSALKNHVSLVVKDYQPDLIVQIIARQIQSESKDPVVMLSMVVHEPFDNVAVIKHWASGFRQAFPYGATIALNNSTRGLVRHKAHWFESASASSLGLLCEKLIDRI